MNPRVAIVGGVVATLLGLSFVPASALAQGSGRLRPDPVGLSQVPVAGWPVYVEDLTIGTPVSDYGSHFGLKASTLDDGAPGSDLFVDARSLLYHATYAANTDDGRQMDEGYLRFVDGEGAARFAPAATREIEFHPWGWEEVAVDGDLVAEGYALTFDEDVFLLAAIVTNGGTEPVTLTPQFQVRNETDPETESSFPASQRDDFAFAEMIEPEVAGVSYAAPFVFGLFGFSVFERAIVAAPAVQGIANIGSLRYYRKRVDLASFVLEPGERRGVYVLVAFDDYATPAADRAVLARAALDAMGADVAEAVEAAVAEADAEWADFLAALPAPHTMEPNDRRIYDLAAAGLRMNVYGPRGFMPGRASVPGKVHFNLFFVWDTPLQALGHNEFDTALARENFHVQFAFDDARVLTPLPQVMTDELRIGPVNAGRSVSQPPVQGFVQDRLMAAGARDDDAFLQAAFDFGREYLAWWESARNRGTDLFFWFHGLETGWDDTPRMGCPLRPDNVCILVSAKGIDAVDLSAWIVLYYRNLADIADLLGETDEAADYRTRAEAIGEAIETNLWSEENGAYFDVRYADGAPVPQTRGLSPAIVFPLFAGTTRDAERVRRVIEQHILNADEFWWEPGDAARFPIPTVAYDDPAYDVAQDGYYWQGQTWMFTNWLVATTLAMYGYEAESAALVRRTLDKMYEANPAGVHETYDSLGAGVGWGSVGPGNPSVFQFGWSTALIGQLLLDRHQRERYVMPGETGFGGYVQIARDFETREILYEVDVPDLNVPHVALEAEEGAEAAKSLGDATGITLTLSDPYGNLTTDAVRFHLPTIRDRAAYLVLPDDDRELLAIADDDGIVADLVAPTPGTPVTVEISDLPPLVGVGGQGGDGNGGGSSDCGCMTAPGATIGATWPTALPLLAGLAYLGRRARRAR